MKGGYCKEADEDYLACFTSWASIDIFCYFSHHRVTVPPACWIEACHRNGVPCLGTLITEGRAGVGENALLLQNAERVRRETPAHLPTVTNVTDVTDVTDERERHQRLCRLSRI